MANLTLEQQRALALANARLRLQKQAKPAPKKKPEEDESFLSGFLPTLKSATGEIIEDVGMLAGKIPTISDILFPQAERRPLGSAIRQYGKEVAESGRAALPEASLEEQRRQQEAVDTATPGIGSQILAGIGRAGAQSISSPDPAVQALGILARQFLPQTEQQAAETIAKVQAPFQTPRGAAEFVAQQLPATAIPFGGGKVAQLGVRGGARLLGKDVAEDALARAVRTGVVSTGGAINAASAGKQAYEDVINAGGTEDEANRAFNIAAVGAAGISGVAARLPGLEQRAFTPGSGSGGVLRSAIRTAAGEAPQEFIEEGGAQLATNVAKLGTAAEVPIGEDVISSGALGAIGGAGFAAPVGALQGFAARGETPPAGEAPPPPPGAEPLRTTTVSYPNRDDPTAPITRTLDVMSEPDVEGIVTVRDETGKAFEIPAADLAEMEAASPAFAPSTEAEAPAAPTVDAATNLERLRLASGTPEGKKPTPRVISLANDVTEALAVDDAVAAQDVIQKRMDALAGSRMSETTKAQRQAELDEAQSIVNDYRAEYGRARATGPAIVLAPTFEPSSIEQAIEQNVALSESDAQAEALRAAEERLRLQRESEFETASLVGQGSPASQAQAARQQLFQSIIEDDTIQNPAGAFRQALRDRGFTNVELNEAERRQLQARRGFTKPANIVPFTGENIEAEVIEPSPTAAEPVEAEFAEVPSPLPPAPPEVVAGAAAPAPSRRAQLMAGTAIEPGVPATAFGEEPAPRPMRATVLQAAPTERGAPTKPERMAAAQELMDILASFGFKDIKVVVKDMLVDSKGELAKGLFRPVDSLILVAMSDPGTMSSTTFHELIHYLKDRGFFTDAEWSAILKYAKRDLISRGITEYAYSGDSRANRDEEIVAEVFREWLDRARGGRPQNNIFAKIQRLLNSIRDFFFQQNMRDAQAVFNSIVNGEFAAREAQPSARVAEAARTGQRPSERPMYAGRSITEPRAGEDEITARERELIAADYAVAQQMERKGEDPATIRVATGWERNPYDNEWRYLQADDMAFESPLLEDMISDFDAAKEYNAMAFNPDGSIELQDLIGHPDLFQIYPEARNIRVFIRKAAPGNTTQGSFDPRDKSIEVYTSATDPLGTLLHEIQHWVQDKEGFATGASPESVWNKLSNEQKLSEADRAVDYLNSQIEDNNRIVEFIDWPLADPDFKRMAKDGLTREDLEELAGSYFIEVPGTDDLMILDLLEILDMQDELAQQAGINPGPINAARLKGVRSQTVSNTKGKRTQIDAIQSGDVTDDSSAAAKAARDVFQTGSRRSTIRYEDTAGEIEARDVTAQRRKSPEELRKAGALASERKRTPSEVVVSRRGQAPSLSVETQPQASVDPEPVRISRLRQAATRWRTSAAWSNIGSQFSGIRAADNWRARSYGLKALPESDSFYSAFEIYLSKKNGQLMQFRRDYVDPIDDAVNDAIKNGVTLDDINDALQARGAAERNAEIAAKNKDMPDGGSGLTDAAAEAILSDLQLSGKMRYINRVLKLHDRLRNKTQEMMVKDGLVSAETMADWKRKYPNYTPYKGWAPAGDMTVEGQPDPHADYGAYEGGRPVYSRVAGLRAKPVKEAKGRSSQAANSLYNMIADAEMFLEMGQRNQVINKVADEYQRDPDAFEGLLTIYDEKHPKIVKGKPVKITDENAYKNGVRAFKNGKPYIIETAPNEEGRATLRAFNNLDAKQLGVWTERFLKVMSVMRGLHTRFNAAFWPREFLRSVSDAAGNVFTEKGRKRSAAYGKAAAMKTWKYSWSPNTMAGVFSHLVNREPGSEEIAFVKALTEEMIVNGGAAGQEFAERAERVAKRMEAELKRLTATGVKAGYYETKEGFSKLLKAVDGINDFVDMVPRVAAYRALTEAGLTPEQAAPIALRSTLDMTKRGRFGRIIDGIFWWTTPSLTNLTRKVTSLDSSTYRKMLIAQLGIGFALGMLNIMNAPDSDDDGEDDYSQLPEWRKLAYMHVYYSKDEKPFTLPVGFLFVFERYVGGKMAEVLAGKISDGKAAVDIMTASQDVGAAFLSSLSPVIRSTEARTLAPTSVAPMYDLSINESFFKSPIYNEPFDESEAKASRVKASTPEVYKTIARGLQEMTGGYGRVKGEIDVSPDQLKYFVDQYTGGVGRLVGGAAEGDIETAKKLNPFYFDPKLVEYSPMSSFYERQPEMKRAIAADKLAEEGDSSELEFFENKAPYAVDAGVMSAYKEAEKELKDLRKDANEMDPKEYKAEQLRIMSDFNRTYNDVKRGQ